MQRFLTAGLYLYFGIYAFEAPIRYMLNSAGHDELIFSRDVLLAVPLALLFVQQAFQHRLHPAYVVYLFVVGLHGLVMRLNLGSYLAVAYAAKMLMTMLVGAVAANKLFQPGRAALVFFFLLWLATFAGVILDKYYVTLPWARMHTSIGDLQVDISRDWQVLGENKRAAGFTRSSIHAGILEPLLALILMFHLRSAVLRGLVATLTVPVIYWTTQKGAILAYVLTLACIAIRPFRPVAVLRIGFFVALGLVISLPLVLPGYHMPNATGMFSLSSFYDRVDDTWPRAWQWIHRHDAFPFGVGLGGISGAQRLYAPAEVDYADNLLVLMYAYCGWMTAAYLGWLTVTVMGVPNNRSPSASQAVATLVFLMFYGCVLSIIEDQMAALFAGGAAAWLAHEVRANRARQHPESQFNTPAALSLGDGSDGMAPAAASTATPVP